MSDIATPKSRMYTDGEYLERNPTWHVEDSAWKAEQILTMLSKHNLTPQTICEVGCGAGEVLAQLQANTDKNCTFFGYDISPQAFELCKQRTNERLRFELRDITKEADDSFDLLLLIDVIEHVEDYLGFLRDVRTKGRYKILLIPLEFTAMGVLRRWPEHSLNKAGHIHFFTKDIALQSLQDTGYTVIDFFYALSFREQRFRNRFKYQLKSRNVILNLMRSTYILHFR